MTTIVRFSQPDVRGCLLGGAIGDAMGGVAERGRLSLSDDTQLTLATCESIVSRGEVDPAHIAATFLAWFRARRIIGIGGATLKAMRDLEAGASWAVSGARGEMAAGNGAAMRIAPLAFLLDPSTQRTKIRDVVRITHHNDEAYAGALALLVALQAPSAPSALDLLGSVAAQLPDSVTRDRLHAIASIGATVTIGEVAERFGSSGYVAESVPLALLASWHMMADSFEAGLDEIVATCGDADTVGSMAGQIAGAHLGGDGLPERLLSVLPERVVIEERARVFAGAVRPEDRRP